MAHLSTEILEKICDLLASANPAWPAVCKAVGIKSESTIWNWRARCQADRKREDTGSPFYFCYRDEWGWWDIFCAKSRREHLLLAESIIRSQAVHGTEEVVRDASQNVLYQKDPAFLGRSDSYVQLSTGCADDEIGWHRFLHDENGHPIPETVVRQAPAQLRLRVLEASHPEYRPTSHQTIDVQSSVHVVHETKPLERPKGERVDLAELRAMAALPAAERRQRIGGSKFPMDANGRPTITAALIPPSRNDAADDQHRGQRPAPYVPPPQQPQPRPSYAKISRSLDDIRGDPPEGGGPANAPGNVR